MKKQIITTIAFTALLATGTASAEIVLIANPNNPASRLFTEQAAQFFLGKANQFIPVDQPMDSSIRKEFYQKVTNKTPAQVGAIWAKIEFSGKGAAPKEYASDAEVKKAVASDPKALGYIDKASVDGSVKVLLTIQ